MFKGKKVIAISKQIDLKKEEENSTLPAVCRGGGNTAVAWVSQNQDIGSHRTHLGSSLFGIFLPCSYNEKMNYGAQIIRQAN
jgi:hypothetical protein